MLDLDPERLPSLSALRRSGSWPVGLLPLDLIAEYLALVGGVRYRRGSGITIDGAPVDDAEVARLASVSLEIAADSLWSPKLPSEVFEHVLARAERDQDAAQALAHREIQDDYEAAEALSSALSTGADYWRGAADRALHSGDTLAADRAAEGEGERWREHADALRITAREVKASPRARALLLKSLRALLPAPETPTVSEDDAAAWLATLDGLDLLRRSDLPRLYEDAGSPGDLPAAELRALAASRWGEPRPLRGIYVYRPARSLERNPA